ncbi:MAG: hypothetical protein OEW15_18515 [Nitrospirota bacterium]|nr:hypothetical protein [Nitrospirota bacterium]
MPSPLKIKRPKQASLTQELLVGSVFLLPLIYLFYLNRKGITFHFANPTINLMAHIVFCLIPLIWIKIFFGNKLEFHETGELSLGKPSFLSMLNHRWWMMLMVWSPLIICMLLLVRVSIVWFNDGIPDFSSSPGSLFWTLLLIFALGVVYMESLQSHIRTVSESGIRTGLTAFCEWENIDHVASHGNTFSIYHKASNRLPWTGFKLSPEHQVIFTTYLKRNNILITDREHPFFMMVKLSVIAATLIIISAALAIYNSANIDLRWILVGTFSLGVAATMVLEKIRGVSKISKYRPEIEQEQ